MSQFQPNAAPGRSFISKINLKFSNLSLLASQATFSEKDGNSETDTLIHNAFVRFFDQRGEPYPEWLGVEVPARSAGRQKQQSATSSFQPSQSGLSLQYQPVRASYNSTHLQQHLQQSFSPQQTASHSRQGSQGSENETGGYTRRSSSRLQEMYNKSRQQSVPGAGYNALQSTSRHNLTGTVGSLRLRDRIMNSSPTQNGTKYDSPTNGSRATWGRN